MIAAARAIRSSSETPDGLVNLSINACFSASAAVRSRTAAEAFSASFSAICFMMSLADGRTASGSALLAAI